MSVNTKVPLILPTKFHPNMPSHFGEMNLNERNFFRVDANLQMIIVTQFRYIFFILISINIKVLLILHTKFQPNIPSPSGENADVLLVLLFLVSAAILNSRPD